jgi:hypothetical protein
LHAHNGNGIGHGDEDGSVTAQDDVDTNATTGANHLDSKSLLLDALLSQDVFSFGQTVYAMQRGLGAVPVIHDEAGAVDSGDRDPPTSDSDAFARLLASCVSRERHRRPVMSDVLATIDRYHV